MPDLFVRSDLKDVKVVKDFKDLIFGIADAYSYLCPHKIIYDGKKTSVLSPYRGA